jgi:hypothetical protein
MINEYQVIAIDSKIDLTERFNQTPKYEARLGREITNKLGLSDGDLIEIKGKKVTAGRIVTIDKPEFDGTVIGLNNLLRNNARVLPEETVTISKVDLKAAQKIVMAPIGKHLKKSDLLTILAKKSFLNKPFVEGDVTYLRSKILRYLLGSVTWLRVVTTDPHGVVVATEDTDFEIIPDPVNLLPREHVIDLLPDSGEWSETDKEFLDKELFLDDNEWAKINTLLELGLFNNSMEAISYLLREGIKARSDLFEKTITVMEQIKHLKENVK